MPVDAPPITVLRRVLATFVAYGLLSLAALSLAIPPGYASPLYPSAGVALAATLAWGPWQALSAAAAALAVNTYLSWSGDTGASMWLPPAISVGVALQAWAAAVLVRRHLKAPFTLEKPQQILRFMMIGGPLACFISASVGTLALTQFSAIERDQWLVTWFTWWCGDSLGVLIAAPIVLSFIGQPREEWMPRRITVALPLAATTALLWLAISAVSRWEDERAEATFSRDASALANNVVLGLRRHLDALDAMHGVYLASQEVSRSEFTAASEPWHAKLKGLQALGWHIRVDRREVPALESRMQAEGLPGFRVFDRPEGRSLTVQDREVVAMQFVEPMPGNSQALGVNVLSIPAAREAIERARRTGGAVATSGFRLTQETGEQTGVVVYRAVYDGWPRTEDQRMATMRGLVFVTLRLGDTLDRLVGESPRGLSLCLYDLDADRALAGDPRCPTSASRRTRTQVHLEPFRFAERRWELRIHSEARAGVDAGWNTWMFSVLGLLAVAMLGTLLLFITGRTLRIEAAVRDRTRRLEHEVHERRLTEEALRDSERRFRNIFNTVPIGVVYTDLEGQIMQANPGFSQLTGFGADELVLMSTSALTHPEDREADVELLQRLARGELPMYRRDKRYLTKDGQVRWVRVLVRPLRDGGGTPYRTVGVVEDITEHLRLQEAERGREAAEAANRAKSEFLSRMSHELRTPLNAMLGFAQLLALDPGSQAQGGRQRDWIEQIQKAGWHLLNMINDVLDLSRIELGAIKLEPVQVSVLAALGESVAMVTAEAARRNVHIEIQGIDDALQLLGDTTRVKQVLTNLLSNAVKYNRDGGVVRVHAHGRRVNGRAWVQVSVADQGLGMSADQLANLFQPFNRLGRERTGLAGTGIGLVISKRLAESMGGSLNVTSTEGVGSCFTLELPGVDTSLPASAAEPEPPPPRPAQYGPRSVHYIEDNEVNVELMRGVLAHRPQVTLTVSPTLAQGLQRLQARSPDLLLLDLHLPDGHGLDLLERIKQDPALAAIPVVVVSADALEHQLEAAGLAGACRYLTKPLDVRQVLEVLDEVLGLPGDSPGEPLVTGTATTPRPG